MTRKLDSLDYEHRYVIAYRNDSTGGEWLLKCRFTGNDARARAHAAFEQWKPDFPQSDIAIFHYVYHPQVGGDWHAGNIRRAAYNWENNRPIPAALGGIINAADPGLLGRR